MVLLRVFNKISTTLICLTCVISCSRDLPATPILPTATPTVPIPPKPTSRDSTASQTRATKTPSSAHKHTQTAEPSRAKRPHVLAKATAPSRKATRDAPAASNDRDGGSPPPKKRRASAIKADKRLTGSAAGAQKAPGRARLASDVEARGARPSRQAAKAAEPREEEEEEEDDGPIIITAADFLVDRPRRGASVKSFRTERSAQSSLDADAEKAPANDVRPAAQPVASTPDAVPPAQPPPTPAPTLQPAAPRSHPESISEKPLDRGSLVRSPAPSPEPDASAQAEQKPTPSELGDNPAASAEGSSKSPCQAEAGRPASRAVVTGVGSAIDAALAGLRDELEAGKERLAAQGEEWKTALATEVEARRGLEDELMRMKEEQGRDASEAGRRLAAVEAELAAVKASVAGSSRPAAAAPTAAAEGPRGSREEVAGLKGAMRALQARLTAIEGVQAPDPAHADGRPTEVESSSVDGEDDDEVGGRAPELAALVAQHTKTHEQWDACEDKDSAQARALLARFKRATDRLNRLGAASGAGGGSG